MGAAKEPVRFVDPVGSEMGIAETAKGDSVDMIVALALAMVRPMPRAVGTVVIR